jgi:hypothetical protein
LTYGRHTGAQHDECRVGARLLFWRLKWKEKSRKVVPKATYHPSVMRRFKEPRVLIYDRETPYRPDLLREHVDFQEVYLADQKDMSAKSGTAALAGWPVGRTGYRGA